MARVLQRSIERKLGSAPAAPRFRDNVSRRNLLRGFRLDFTGTSEDEQTVRRDTFCGLARRRVLQFVAQEERFRIEELVVDGDDARAVALGAESERGED